MPDYTDWAEKNNTLIRKALRGSVFVAPYSAAIPATFTGADSDLVAAPVDYVDLGWTDSAGVTLARALNSVDTTSWGSLEATRTDISGDTTTIQVIAQETKALVIGIYEGVDPADITSDANGEIEIIKPPIAAQKFYRLVVIGVDTNESGNIYIIKVYPRAKVTAYANEVFSAAGPLQYDLTFTAFTDPVLGYASKVVYSGPGLQPLLTSMGVEPASPPAGP